MKPKMFRLMIGRMFSETKDVQTYDRKDVLRDQDVQTYDRKDVLRDQRCSDL